MNDTGHPPAWTMELPPEWKTAEWARASIRPMLEVPSADAMAAQAMLKDGTNLVALMWPTGQRILRMGPDTGLAMQEHFTGAIPKEHRTVLSDVWATIVNLCVEAAARADEDMRRQSMTTTEVACMREAAGRGGERCATPCASCRFWAGEGAFGLCGRIIVGPICDLPTGHAGQCTSTAADQPRLS